MSISSLSSATNTNTAAASPASTADKPVTGKAFAAVIGQLRNQIDRFEHQATWQIDRKRNVSLPAGASSSNAGDGTASTTAKTIADGIAGLESKAAGQLTGLTAAQQKKLAAVKTQLSTETTRFQGFISRRASTLAKASRHADAQDGEVRKEVSDFEHQISFQIDQGETATSPNDLKTATAADTQVAAATAQVATTPGTDPAAAETTTAATPTLAQTLADGFAAIEANATARLKNAPTQLQGQLQQLQQNLSTEATRFAAFAIRRAAYHAANPKEFTNKDVTA